MQNSGQINKFHFLCNHLWEVGANSQANNLFQGLAFAIPNCLNAETKTKVIFTDKISNLAESVKSINHQVENSFMGNGYANMKYF